MGDRGNIQIKGKDIGGTVNFYTHWSGSHIREITATALARRQRWDDGGYLARIIFCGLIGDDVKGETGYGIACEPLDNEHPIIVVDVDKQTVVEVPDKRKDYGFELREESIKEPMSFGDFVAKYATAEKAA